MVASYDGALAVIALALCVAPLADAHNWMNNPPSRSQRASMAMPCLPRHGDAYHISTTKRRDFWLEWAAGHFDYTYIVIVKAEDEDALKDLTTSVLDDYLASEDHPQYLPNTKYDRRHVRSIGCNGGACKGVSNEEADVNAISVLSREVQPTDFDFTRPGEDQGWRCAMQTPENGCGGTTYKYYEYTADALENDKRKAYTSTQYPKSIIIAAGKYALRVQRPYDHDLVAFQMPSGVDDGDYIVHYIWKGYRDCMDVKVSSSAVAPLSKQPMWVKIDHCQFRNTMNEWPKVQCKVLPSSGDATECRNSCNEHGSGNCMAVNVVPFRNPSIAFNAADRNIPEGWRGCSDSDLQASIASTPGVTEATAQICYGFSYSTWTVFQPYNISHDPEDSVFYSTCFVYHDSTFRLNGAPANPSPPQPPLKYTFSDKCMACDKATQLQSTQYNVAPRYEFTDSCKPCVSS